MESSIDFRIFQPKGLLAAHVQGVWAASVSPHESNDLIRWLYSDAGSGIVFNLTGDIYLADAKFSSGVILQPVCKQAQSITLPPGSQLVGVRFHPAVGFGVLGTHFEQPIALEDEDNMSPLLYSLCEKLINTPGHYARIIALYRWLHKAIDFSDLLPNSLAQALNALQRSKTPGQLSDEIPLSQRQLERQFQKWIGITPKHYQRIIRVTKTRNSLKHNPDVDLVDLALKKGFTDQAHMTREFKQIAQITPKKYTKLLKL